MGCCNSNQPIKSRQPFKKKVQFQIQQKDIITEKVIQVNEQAQEEEEKLDLSAYETPQALLELCIKPDNLKIINSLITKKFKLDTILNIRGKSEQLVLEAVDEIYLIDKNKQEPVRFIIDTVNWNPLHFAILYDQILYVKYFVEQNQEPLCFAFQNPLGEYQTSCQYQTKQSKKIYIDEIFMILICLRKKNFNTLNYLLNELSQYWSYSTLKVLFANIMFDIHQSKQSEALQYLITGNTLKMIFNSRSIPGKLQLVEEIIEPALDWIKLNKDQNLLKKAEILIESQPLLGVTFYKLIKGDYIKLFGVLKSAQLKKIQQTLTHQDIIDFMKELSLEEDDFINDLGTSSLSFEGTAYHEFIAFVRRVLLQKPKNNYKEEILSLSKNGSKNELDIIIQKYKISTIQRVFGSSNQIELLKNDTYSLYVDTKYWNPLIIALYGKNIALVKYYLEKFNFNFHKTFFLEPDMDPYDDTFAIQNELLPFIIIIHHQNVELLNLIISSSFNFLWGINHLKQVFDIIKAEKWEIGLQTLLQSKYFKVAFQGFIITYESKIELLKSIYYPIEAKDKTQFGEQVNSICCQSPFAMTFLILLLQNYDFMEKIYQQDLATLCSNCIENINQEDIEEWLNDQKKIAISLIIVKEFLVRALDDSVPQQKTLKMKLLQFFMRVRNTSIFSILEQEADIISDAPSRNISMVNAKINQSIDSNNKV